MQCLVRDWKQKGISMQPRQDPLWKNKLQEYTQKRQLPNPTYSTVAVTVNNAILFRSKANVQLETHMLVVGGSDFSSKKEAEKDAAREAYSTLTEVDGYTSIYLIDLENVPYFSRRTSEDCLYLGFIGSTHHAVKKYSDWYQPSSRKLIKESTLSNKLLYVIEGGCKDLVDHYLTMFVTSVVSYIRNSGVHAVIYIVTGDKAGWCTAKCLEYECRFQEIEGHVQIVNTNN